tara:strand:- start:567 stop:758 length:192 start_codon:yes stop_codon:yes gene_type:complete
MKLSNQAIGALLMTLQKCLSEQSDITELLSDWELEVKDEEIFVSNPPTFQQTQAEPEVRFDIK